MIIAWQIICEDKSFLVEHKNVVLLAKSHYANLLITKQTVKKLFNALEAVPLVPLRREERT